MLRIARCATTARVLGCEPAIDSWMPAPPRTLVIGAAGAVGKRLCAALRSSGAEVIASDRHEHMPSTVKQVANVLVGGVDVRDKEALGALFEQYGGPDTAVWNLASPLSVETAMSPELSEAITIGGMKNVLGAMKQSGCRRICFTDSIGSFGSSSPRENVAASWLVGHPTQDPGSDYGKQKRACRELLHEFQMGGGDPRWAVVPGVLHSEPVWGNGTTEYALDALLSAAMGRTFECPVDPDVILPMVFVDDLMRGLIALQFADEEELKEPSRGYCIPGISFSPNELFHEIRQHIPDFEVTENLNENMNTFANLWPDRLATTAPSRDLDYEPVVTMPRMVAQVLNAHQGRKLSGKAAFRSIDTCESGQINDYMLEKCVPSPVPLPVDPSQPNWRLSTLATPPSAHHHARVHHVTSGTSASILSVGASASSIARYAGRTSWVNSL